MGGGAATGVSAMVAGAANPILLKGVGWYGVYLPVQLDGLISSRGMSDSSDRIADKKGTEEWDGRKGKGTGYG